MGHRRAVVVPGGGVTATGRPQPWVVERLDRAVRRRRDDEPIICLSAGTVHKPPPTGPDGFPVTEAAASAAYLVGNGVPPRCVWQEGTSYDTIGNAFFSRVVHVDPARVEQLLVITSDFHVPRVRAAFDWVYGLEPRSGTVLTYESVPDVGLADPVLEDRRAKEREGLARLAAVRSAITSLESLHRFLYAEHDAYRSGVARRPGPRPAVDSY